MKAAGKLIMNQGELLRSYKELIGPTNNILIKDLLCKEHAKKIHAESFWGDLESLKIPGFLLKRYEISALFTTCRLTTLEAV